MPDAKYMDNQPDINMKMRKILVDWLLKVHTKFKLLPETFFLTVNIIDRYLSHTKVTRKVLQLVGVTAMHIACKYEEIYPPESNDFVYITDNAYSKKELLDTEYKILKTLNFDLTFPSCFRYLERFCTLTGTEKLFQIGHKFLKFAAVEYGLIKYQPSVLAAGVLYLAHMLEKRKAQKKAHQSSSASLASSHSKSKDGSAELSTILLLKLSKEDDIPEEQIKM